MLSRIVASSTAALSALAMGLFLQGLPTAAAAHDFGGSTSGGSPPPQKPPPPCSIEKPCQCPPPAKSDKPISYWNGSESFAVPDLMLRGQFPLEITRRYDSQSEFDSPLGFGWAFDHERYLFEYPDGSVIVRLSCGVRERFVSGGGGFQRPAGGVLGTLTQLPDGTFRLGYADGSRDYFDSQGRLTAAEHKSGARHEYTYDSRGKLPLTGTSTAAVDPSAPMVVANQHRVTRIDERSADGALTGRYVTIQYNESTGRVTSVTANDGRVVSYEHDTTAGLTRGNLVQVTGLNGVVATYAYADPNDQHNLTSITEAAGRTPIVNTYDDQDRVIRQEEGTRRIDFNYQTPLVKTIVTRTVKDQNGANPYTTVDTYEFDSTGRTTKHIDPLGNEERYVYNPVKDLVRKEVWEKNGGTLSLLQATDFTYDTFGHKLTESVTLDNGEVVTRSWTYDHDLVASTQVVSSAAPAKLFRTEYTYFYDGNGLPTTIKEVKRRKDDGSFQTTSYTYDSRNRVLTTTYPDGVKLVNEYTGDHITKVYFEVGGVEIPQESKRFEYDARGLMSKAWDARNNLTEYEFDDRGRPLSLTNPLGEKRIYTYTADLLTQVEEGHTSADGEGKVVKLVYDTRGRLIAMQRKDDAGVFQPFETYELNSEGWRLSVTDAVNRATTTTYDLLGRAVTIRNSLNETLQIAYSAVGNRTSVTDAPGRQVKFEYDDLNRTTARVQLGVTPNARSEYTYDAAGNLIAYKDDENHITTFEFDALSRNTGVTQPLGQTIEHSYDSRDRLDQTINARSQKIDYVYEPWGPLKEEKFYPTASATVPDRTITYSHDDDGNETSVVDDAIQATASRVMTYDAVNRLYDETIKYLPAGDRVLNHRYDRYGNRKELTLQDGSPVVSTYTYNKLNQLASATLAGAAVTLSNYANDDRQSISLPGGVSQNFTYEVRGPIDTITVTGPAGTIAQFDYTYDSALNVDSVVDADGTHDLSYDGLDRLTGATRPAGLGLTNESYSYDRVGNREDPSNAALYTYDANNRMTGSPSLTTTYDADGSIATRSDGAGFTHDARNRLVGFTKSGTTASYVNDHLGRRVRKTVNGVTTWYVWDGPRLLAEFSGTGSRQIRYAYLGEDVSPTQLENSSGTFYVHADRLATPRVLTNSAAVVVWRARYSAFGKAVVDEDPDGNSVSTTFNLRFAGQYFDAESGLHYNHSRTYDPNVGRYVQADPSGLSEGPNLYAYVDNNPALWIDPLGEAKHGDTTYGSCNHVDYDTCNSRCGSRGVLKCVVRYVTLKKRIMDVNGKVWERIVTDRSVLCECGDPEPEPEPDPEPVCGDGCQKTLVVIGVAVLVVCCILQPEICALGAAAGGATAAAQ